jgi:hypothetical protein
MAVYSNLYIDQGADFSSIVTVENVLGQLFDLTNYSARGQIRKTYSSSNSIDFSANIPNPQSGEILLELTSSQTREMKAGRYVYDVEIFTSNDTEVIRVVEGQIMVNPEVTR